jgi:all-trans-retinol 13,14-reductase
MTDTKQSAGAEERRIDIIVIGSGIGGLTAAAALAKRGRRVLVLEQHTQLGGLTQVFHRHGYSFATGVHYIGGVGDQPGPEGMFGRLLRLLSDGRLRFSSVGSPYDIVRLPGMEFPIEAPFEAFRARLVATFPDETASIDQFFRDCQAAGKTSQMLFQARGMPTPLAAILRFLYAKRIRRALDTMVAGAVRHIRDRRLAAILAARWGDHGMTPDRAPLAIHALVTGSYFSGAYYPAGGPATFATSLGETITGAGGMLRTRTAVSGIRVANGRVAGVRLEDGETIDAPIVISAMGAQNTAAALPDYVAPKWRATIGSLKPSVTYVTLYLGFRGDIRLHGATAANVWVYESDDIGAVWERPGVEDAPSMFVSFPSVKNSDHADPEHHTAEVVVICRWEPFAPWAASQPHHRPAEYQALKARMAERLLAQFRRHFPPLAPLVDFHELSTPLSQAAFVGADHGAMYGLEMSPERLRDPALRIRTPVPGLLLAGQDVASMGVPGALIGGFMAAATIEPRLWRELMA